MMEALGSGLPGGVSRADVSVPIRYAQREALYSFTRLENKNFASCTFIGFWCKLSKRQESRRIMVRCEHWICLRDGSAGSHGTLRALVSGIQTELAGSGPNDGRAQSCVTHTTISSLGAALCTGV